MCLLEKGAAHSESSVQVCREANLMQVRAGTALISVCDECITHSRTSIWAAGSPQGLQDTGKGFC